jgi:hypothetical protein
MAKWGTIEQKMRAGSHPVPTALRSVVSDAVWHWQHTHGVTVAPTEQEALITVLCERVGDMLARESAHG